MENKMKSKTFVLIIISVFLLSFSYVFAGIPRMINYQGMLSGSDGKTPVTDGNYSILFSIYNTSSGGSSLWSHTYNVGVTNGLFNVILGDSGAPINLPFDTTYWLGMKVGADPELSPRIRLTSVGYAYRSLVADSASKSGSAGGVGWTDAGTKVYLTTNSDSVGIGTTSPTAKLQVAGTVHSTTGGFKFPDGTTQTTAAAGSGGGWTDDGSVVKLTTSTDKVGIGTSSPDTYSKLHIVVPRTQSFDRVTIECPRDSNGFGIEFKQPNGYWRLGQNVGNGWNNYFSISNNISPYYRLMILSDGKVGIGITDPKVKLDVSDIIRVRGSAPAWPAPGTGKGMELAYDSSLHRGYVQVYDRTAGAPNGGWGNLYLGDGKVGIGNTAPDAKLDVYSTISNWPAIKSVSTNDLGIDAKGKSCGAHFYSNDYSGYAYVANGHTGIDAFGNTAGGFFQSTDGSGSAWLGYDWYAGLGGWFEGGNGGADFTCTGDGTYAGIAWFGGMKIYGTGSVNFVQNHPTNKDQVIVYAAPEGDEVATYTRGTGKLVGGEARIQLGETFKWVTNPDIGLTAHLTPRGDCKGLYVASLTTGEMVVRELQGGTSDVAFDFIVYGLRIGFEETCVINEKTRESYIPSMAYHRGQYNKYPELRHFNALERFKEMNSHIGKSVPDMNSSQALKDAIHEFDPAIDKLPGHDK
jgi:hypothetical protein